MSRPRLAYAVELVELLDGLELDPGDPDTAKLSATIDPDEAAAGLPAVLVVPPALDFTAHEPILTWSLKLLSSSTAGGVGAWEELDAMVHAVERALPVESGAAGVYALTPDYPAVPCYSLALVTQGPLT